MATKQVRGVIVPRHDTAENWARALNFIPRKGELIVYDADTTTYDTSVRINSIECSVKSSDKVRFKFGDGNSNVNVLPFATTDNAGGTEGLSEEQVIELIKQYSTGGYTEEEILELIREYSKNEAAAIVYLNTKQEIGDVLELQDVYPIQSDSTFLRVVPKNRLIADETFSHTTNGITIGWVNGECSVKGKPSTSMLEYITIGYVDTSKVTGKYELMVSGRCDDSTNKKCYITYRLLDKEGEVIQSNRKITDTIVSIDAKELSCAKIELQLHLYTSGNVTFENGNERLFRPIVTCGNITDPNIPLFSNIVANRPINIYGRNLFNPDNVYNMLTSGGNQFTEIGNTLDLGGVTTPIESNGVYYIKSITSEDFNIYVSTLDMNYKITTPLLAGDKFTFIFNVDNFSNDEQTGTINNIQIVYGHTDYEEYHPFEMETIRSGEDGVCDISKIKYPYSFIAKEPYSAYTYYTSQIQYDPALSRDWTEKQLKDINNKIDSINVGDIILSDYAKKSDIPNEVSEAVNNKIVTYTSVEDIPENLEEGTIVFIYA